MESSGSAKLKIVDSLTTSTTTGTRTMPVSPKRQHRKSNGDTPSNEKAKSPNQRLYNSSG